MTEETKKTVVINLDDSTYARSFETANLVHIREYNHVLELLNRQIDKIEEYDRQCRERNEEPYTYRTYNNSIAILGGRGSGKTSFLKSVLKYYHSGKNCENGEIDKNDRRNKVKVLSLIDPTMLEDSGHVLVLIVSLIDKEVRAACERGEFDIHSESFENKRRWQVELKKISCGLAMLEGLGNGFKKEVNWQDDNFVMNKGFQAVSASFDLGRNFHHLVETALDILGKKAFMLAFDDVDVDMRRGWKVLESIRKYITTPKILCLVSGNIKLYSINVRIQQWNQFKEIHNIEKESDYSMRVNELEGQYLLKILKIENRVHLDSLQEAIRYTDYHILDAGFDKPIREKYTTIIHDLGINESSIVRRFVDYLLSLSLRSQINLLRSRIIENGIGVSCVEAFLSRMLACDIPVDLAVQNPNMLVPIIANYLIGHNLLKENYQLVPTSRDSSVNACVTGLTIIFMKHNLSNPFVLWDYMLRVAYMRNIVSSIIDGKLIEGIASYVNLRHDGTYKNMIGMSMAYKEGMKIMDMSEHIRLYSLNKSAKDGNSNRIDSVLKDKKSAIKALGMIPLCALKKTSSNSSSSYYSVFLLFATICQVLKTGNEDKNEVIRLIKEAQIYRYYPVPTSDKDNLERSVEKDDIFSDGDSSADPTFDKLIDSIVKWKKDFSKVKTRPPHLLGRIMTRFYSSVKNVKKDKLGEQMHLSIVCFLNSCLIEEAREYVTDATKGVSISDINFSNVVSSDKIFMDNLSKIPDEEINSIIGFTTTMARCPLIYNYLDVSLFANKKSIWNDDVIAGNEEQNIKVILDKIAIIDQNAEMTTARKRGRNTKSGKPIFYYSRKNWGKTKDYLEKNGIDIYNLLKSYTDEQIANHLNGLNLFSTTIKENMIRSVRQICIESRTI